MTLYWKAAAGVLVAVILVLTLQKQEKDLALMLSMAVCIMAAGAALSFLEPVLDFLYRLSELGNLRTEALETLLKVAGIGLTGELAGMICQDSGNASLARGMQLLTTAVILTLSLPIYETLLDLILGILGEL